MTPDTTLSLGCLEALDFDPELPCEHSGHEAGHDPASPGRFLVSCSDCPECASPGREYILCESGWQRMGRIGVRCLCGFARDRDEWVTILVDLQG